METVHIGQLALTINVDKANFGILALLFVFLLLYSIYSLVALAQVRILNKSIHAKAAPVLNSIATFQLFFSVGLLLIVIFFLLS